MALSVCSESVSLTSSPRISFSHDLRIADIVPVENCPHRSDSSLTTPNTDFNFQINDLAEIEPSSADELFSQGLIRPVQLQNKFAISKQDSLPEVLLIPTSNETPCREVSETDQIEKHSLNHNPLHHNQSKSFWRIKRSSSLNCDDNYKKSSFWSLPLLSRSNSTGSVQILKNLSNQKKNHSNVQKQSKSSNIQKPPPYKKNYNNGIRINPVLNVPVPPPFISKGTANLFGLGSLFRNGKERKNKK